MGQLDVHLERHLFPAHCHFFPFPGRVFDPSFPQDKLEGFRAYFMLQLCPQSMDKDVFSLSACSAGSSPSTTWHSTISSDPFGSHSKTLLRTAHRPNQETLLGLDEVIDGGHELSMSSLNQYSS